MICPWVCLLIPRDCERPLPLTDRLGLYETDSATRLMLPSVLIVRLIPGDLLPEKAPVALKQLTQCLMDFFLGE